MRIVLDSNEYIIFLNKKSTALNELFEKEGIVIYVNGSIVKEVLRNVAETIKSKFYKILFKNKIEVNDKILPFYLFGKYKKIGLKKGDIAIAAFCEFIKADYLITENRHFLKEAKFKEFKVVAIKDFLSAYHFKKEENNI